MSLTNTDREARRAKRPVGLRDLRFASTVAAGLVAGVLGVGALSAPLLGWSDWPRGLEPGSNDEVVRMPAPAERTALVDRSTESSPDRSTNGPAGTVLPGGAVVVVPGTGVAVSVGTGTAGGGGTVGAGAGSSPGGDGGSVRVGSGSNRNSDTNDFGGQGFAAPDMSDSDGDGMPDVWESRYGTDPLVNDAGSDSDGDGVPNYAEFRTGSLPLAQDSNGDGIPDGENDSDGDGVRNIVEVRTGSQAW